MSTADPLTELILRVAVGGLRAAAEGVLPVAGAIQRHAAEAERAVIRAIRDHIDGLDASADGGLAPDGERVTAPTPRQSLQSLLQRSIDDGIGESREALYQAVVAALLPDEARILAAVAEGGRYAVVHVGPQGMGASTELVLENASSVGRAAGVTLPQYTPRYVSRMHQLGLITIGAEDSSIRDDYEMLLAEAPVRAAIAKASPGLLPARVIRRSLWISDLGRDVWEAASC
jgi:hypothetical protein